MQLWLAVIHLLLVLRLALVETLLWLVADRVLIVVLLVLVADRVLVEVLLVLVAVLVLGLETTPLALVLAALHQQTLRKAHRILPEPVV